MLKGIEVLKEESFTDMSEKEKDRHEMPLLHELHIHLFKKSGSSSINQTVFFHKYIQCIKFACDTLMHFTRSE